MAHIQTESEWQEEMSAKIVEFVRHELYMELRYLKTGIIAVTVKVRSRSAGICDGRCVSLCGTGMADRDF